MRLRRLNIMGETRKQVQERRLTAVEDHVTDLEVRLSALFVTHLHEFHQGQACAAAEKAPEE